MTQNFKITHLPEVDSTNNFALSLLNKKSNISYCNTVIHADFQTSGKGAYKNTWESNKAENLLFSIIICPEISAENQFLISKITSLSLIEYLKSHGIQAKIKWPNDILVNQKKIAGILIENSILGHNISTSTIGIGLNINQLQFSIELKAISLSLLKSNQKFDLSSELDKFLLFFKKWLNICHSNSETVHSEYFLKLWGTTEILNYKDDNQNFKAKIHNIDDFGRVTLQLTDNQLKTYGFKEVELIY